MQSDLKWNLHFEEIAKRCRSAVYVVRLLLRNGIPKNTVWSTYQAMFFSIVIYCWPAVCDVSAGLLMSLVSLDDSARRLCAAQCLPLRQRLDKIASRLSRKVLARADHPLRRFLVPTQTSYRTRSNKSFGPPRCRLQSTKNSFLKFF